MRDKINKKMFAYLTDRILVNKKRKQIYGTQFYTNRRGQYIPRPIRDIKNLDKRRKAMSLGIFSKYKKIMKKV